MDDLYQGSSWRHEHDVGESSTMDCNEYLGTPHDIDLLSKRLPLKLDYRYCSIEWAHQLLHLIVIENTPTSGVSLDDGEEGVA